MSSNQPGRRLLITPAFALNESTRPSKQGPEGAFFHATFAAPPHEAARLDGV
jgi:hypothetical protein